MPLIAALLTAACRTGSPSNPSGGSDGGAETGATSARAATEGLLAALRAEDLQAISALWGNANGPARSIFPREELEKREVAMVACFRHDRSRVVSEGVGENGGRKFQIDLSRGATTKTTSFNTVRASTGRWYVDVLDINAVREFCQQKA